jgi:tRNA wybutosine-synthesizing protein 2
MRVREVPREALPKIAYEDWVDPERRPYAEGDRVWVPVKPGMAYTHEIPELHRYRGRGFFMLGNVAVIHGKKPSPDDIFGIVSFRRPEGILWIEELRDITRTPKTEVMWGEVGEVCHRESGYAYYLDPRKVMFAQGNRNEKIRMAQCISMSPVGSRVADMFAGIGYFTVPMAGSGAVVHAMEINPVAFEYLKRNIRANDLSTQVEPARGDCRDLLSGEYDRVVMGHFDAVHLLPQVMPHVHEGSVIHLHSLGTVADAIRKVVGSAGFSSKIEVHTVKKYRPHVWHIVQDVTLS